MATPSMTDAANEILEEAGLSTSGRPASQATTLIALAESAELWHEPDRDALASIKVDEHQENWPIRSKGFRQWLQQLYWQAHKAAPGSQAIQDALGVLEGKALYDGQEHLIFTRLAMHEGRMYLDLANSDWEVVEITKVGWKVIQESPVKFKRTKGMAPMTTPVAGGDINLLRAFVNIGDERDWILLMAWLIAALWPEGPYPVLIINGEQGSAKSTLAEIIKGVIDPNKAPLRSQPRNEHDLMIAAGNSWCLVFDNLSSLPNWLSDALCRLSTGGGFSTRTLYENEEETIFQVQRPVILNGIEELATRGDLQDRALNLHLMEIPEEKRMKIKVMREQFDGAKAQILGAMLDVMPFILRELPYIEAEKFPRMADFAAIGIAMERALGLPKDSFMDAYAGSRDSVHQLILESTSIGETLISFAHKGEWSGTMSDLLKELDDMVLDSVKNRKNWPKDSTRLSNMIKRIVPSLRKLSVHVEFKRANQRRLVTIRTGAGNSVTSVTSPRPMTHEPDDTAVQGGDARGDAAPTPASSIDHSASPGGNGPLPDAQAVLALVGDAGDAGDAEIRSYSNDDEVGEV
jgi:hypothetical protein